MENGKLSVLVVGAGALGVFFSSKLALAGAEVSVVARSDYDALAKRGGVYEILSCKGDYTFKPHKIYRSIDEIETPPDILICALKVLPGVNPITLCAPAIGPSTSVMVIQNGLGNEEPFHMAFPNNEVVGVVAYIGAGRPENAVIRHLDGGSLALGSYPENGKISEKIMHVATLFREQGIPVSLEENITKKRWYKLLWNTSYNTISVLGVSADTSIIMGDEDAVKLVEAVMAEIVEIAHAEGYDIPIESIEQNLDYTRGFAAYKPSTLQDYEAGRPIEIDALIGTPLKIADKHALAVPHMRTIYALLKLASRKS